MLDGPVGKELTEKSLARASWCSRSGTTASARSRTTCARSSSRGLKIRTPADSVTVDIMTALGATVQQLKFTKVHGALGAGVMDGQENPIPTIESAKLYEVQKFMSLTGHKYESTPVVMMAANLQKLPEADRKAVMDAARESLTVQRKLTNEADDKALGALKAKGMTIDKVDTAAFTKATAGVTDKWAASEIGPFVKQVVAASK
ncbi:MAG: TRAP transporter substrate-binding protein [Rhizobiales bacterium]|nr:TRAP transporter substrate-binding protein [Rhizobacter sp.]